MTDFGLSALAGVLIGFLFGVGCAMAVLYTIYLGGYRKAVEDSLKPERSKRWLETAKRLEERAAREAHK